MTPYLRSANVGDGRLDLSDVKEMDFDPTERERFGLQVGDVLVSEGSASAAAVGMASVWNGEVEGPVCFQNTLLRFRAVEGRTLPGFVLQWCRWAFESGAFLAAASGTNIKHIGSSRAARMPVALPTLDEQRRIVDVMAAVDTQIDAMEGEADLAMNVALSVAEEAWAAGADTSLTEHFEVVDCEHKTAPPTRPGEAVAGYSIGTGDLRNGQIVLASAKPVSAATLEEWTVRTAPRDGDLIFSREAPVGQVGRVSEVRVPVCLGQRTVLLRSKTGYPSDSLWVLLMAPTGQTWLNENSLGLTVQRINVSTLKKLPIPERVPPEVTSAFTAAVQARMSLTEELESLRTFRSTLLSALLSQEIEIPESYDKVLSTLRG